MKSRRLLFIISMILALHAIPCMAQQEYHISGKIVYQDKQPVPSATILLKDSASGRIISYALSKGDGRFIVRFKQKDSVITYLLTAGHIETQTDSLFLRFSIHAENTANVLFQLKLNPRQLKEVIIRSAPQSFSIRGDTIEFMAKSYKSPETRKVQDMLKNIQGFSVGSDGKISFNGRPLDKILIDGEDLAEKNYTLLSKNLNADLVSRIQVLNNFNDDRLMKEVETSGKVGINLVTDSSYRNRLSGTIEAGSGPEGRKWVDDNLILLGKKIKLLGFLNFNDIGRAGNEDLDYYFNQDMPAVQSGRISANSLVNTGEIYPPDIGQTYTRNNRDFTSSAISSFKGGEYVKWKMLISGSDHIQINTAGGYQHVVLSDTEKWTLYAQDAFSAKNRDFIARLSLTHDRKKGNNGYWSFQFINSGSRNNYFSRVSGALHDTLDESLSGRSREMQVSGSESFRIKQNTVLKVTSRTSFSILDQDLHVQTLRYRDYFHTDPSYRLYDQSLDGTTFRQESDIRLSSRHKSTDLTYGLKSSVQVIRNNRDLNSRRVFNDSSILLAYDNSRFRNIAVHAYGMLTRRLTRKSLLAGGGSAGLGTVSVDNKVDADKFTPLFQAVAGYEYRPKPLVGISINYRISRTLPVMKYFFPEPLLTGNVSIISPAGTIIFPLSQYWSIQCQSQNLYRGTAWQLMVSYNLAAEDYINSLFLRPAYSYVYYVPVRGNRQWHLMGGIEKYHQRFKIKSSFQTSLTVIKNKLFINNLENLNASRYLRAEGKLSTAFKAWFNLDLSGVVSYNRNVVRPDGIPAVAFSFWQYQGRVKIRSRLSEKFYIAVLGNFFDLAGTVPFHSLDAFASYSISPRWLLTVNFHNLFNSSVIVQRYTSLNSESEQRFDLVGRYMVLKLAWNF